MLKTVKAKPYEGNSLNEAGQLWVEGFNSGTIAQRDADMEVLKPIVEALNKILTIEEKADGLRGSGMVEDSDIKALRATSKAAKLALALWEE
jgi:hypothetical protein